MTMDKKIIAGHKIRRLRIDQGLTQAQMANDLGISTSYLNLIERNQRPISASVLLKLTQVYDIDLKTFSSDDDLEVKARYEEIFNDPLFSDLSLRQQDYRDLVALAPEVCDAIEKLYNSYKSQKNTLASGKLIEKTELSDEDVILDTMQFFRSNQNYFEDLENIAEQIRIDGEIRQENLYEGLSSHLQNAYRVEVSVLPFDIMQDTERRYDYHQRRLLLNEILSVPARSFQIAVQLALFGYRDQIELIIERHNIGSKDSRKLIRLGLANYLAGAILLPYQKFLQAARQLRYDLDILEKRFQVSPEQVRHRLTTLRNPDAKGIPFFFVRVDKSGHISKRVSIPGMHFPIEGGLCPRWNVQQAYNNYPRPSVEVIENQEGKCFLTVSYKLTKGMGGYDKPLREYVIVLGCPIEYAQDWVYGDGVDISGEAATPIGPSCKLCNREHCAWRTALPVTGGRLSIDEYRRYQSPYRVLTD